MIDPQGAAVERAIGQAVRAFRADVDSPRHPLTEQSMRTGAHLAWDFAEGGGYGSVFGDAVRLAKQSGMERAAWVDMCVGAWIRQAGA